MTLSASSYAGRTDGAIGRFHLRGAATEMGARRVIGFWLGFRFPGHVRRPFVLPAAAASAGRGANDPVDEAGAVDEELEGLVGVGADSVALAAVTAGWTVAFVRDKMDVDGRARIRSLRSANI